jgi:hypothetical protein
MSARIWASTPDVATAADEVAGMSREQLVARITYMAPALTDDGLRVVAIAAMTAKRRPLDRETLGRAQQERESTVEAITTPEECAWCERVSGRARAGAYASAAIVGVIDGKPVPVRGST